MMDTEPDYKALYEEMLYAMIESDQQTLINNMDEEIQRWKCVVEIYEKHFGKIPDEVLERELEPYGMLLP